MLKRALKMSLRDVRLAVTPVSREQGERENSIPLLAQLAVERLRFLSFHARISLYIAALASLR